MSHILHLSDPHFSENPGVFAFADDPRRWALAIATPLRLLQWIPRLVVVSGDLTQFGDSAEFALASQCLDQLRHELGADLQYLVVPGNHDMRWRVNGKTASESERLAAYSQFVRGLGNAVQVTQELGGVYCDASMTVFGLNSARIEKEETAGLGLVGHDQVENLRNRARKDPAYKAEAPRIFVLHHHLLPVSWSETMPDGQRRYSLTLDAERVQQLLMEENADLVLHGHQHQPFIREVIDHLGDGSRSRNPRRLVVAAAGSVSVARSELGTFGRNQFQTVSISRTQIEINYFVTSYNDPHKFVPIEPVRIGRSSRARVEGSRRARTFRVSISGAMSVGKTTLARDIKDALGDDILLLPEVGRRMLAQARGADQTASDEDYLEYVRLHLVAMGRDDAPIMVHVRSLVDVYAYARIDGRLQESTIRFVGDAAEFASKHIDLFVFVPIEAHLPLERDGVRKFDPEYRERLNTSTVEALAELGIDDYTTVRGTRQERVEIIRTKLALRG